jgi:hypothetical protein
VSRGALNAHAALSGLSAGTSGTTGSFTLAWALAGVSTGTSATVAALSVQVYVPPIGRLEAGASVRQSESGGGAFGPESDDWVSSSTESSGGVLALIE